jgi:hypothetical protein
MIIAYTKRVTNMLAPIKCRDRGNLRGSWIRWLEDLVILFYFIIVFLGDWIGPLLRPTGPLILLCAVCCCCCQVGSRDEIKKEIQAESDEAL